MGINHNSGEMLLVCRDYNNYPGATKTFSMRKCFRPSGVWLRFPDVWEIITSMYMRKVCPFSYDYFLPSDLLKDWVLIRFTRVLHLTFNEAKQVVFCHNKMFVAFFRPYIVRCKNTIYNPINIFSSYTFVWLIQL